ncbi:MAG: helix-turn-helix transcriptional regulator, partial [Bacteroidota bacterium]
MGSTSNPIRNRIRVLRFHQGEMTQRALADAVGVSGLSMKGVEGVKYAPSLVVAFRIAAVFGVPFEEVFQYAPEND